ncbi:hypothetical protein [Streptomyces chartreusis]
MDTSRPLPHALVGDVVVQLAVMDAAVSELRADGFDVRDEDVARLSLPDLPGGLRPLRDPDATDEE